MSTAARERELRAAWKAKGLCYQCGKRKPAPGLSRCKKCQKYHADYRQRRRKARVCNKCGGPLEPRRRYCQKCKDEYTVYAAERRAMNRRWLLEYKLSHPCARCGEPHPACLDFHHVGDDKVRGVSTMINCALTTLQREVAKCTVLCANCHRKEHWEDTLQAQAAPGNLEPIQVQFKRGANVRPDQDPADGGNP